MALARYLADGVEAAPDFELMAPQSLSIVCFRYAPPGVAEADTLDRLNRERLERLQVGGEAFRSGTELRGRFVHRACIVNHRSTRDDVDRLLPALRRAGA